MGQTCSRSPSVITVVEGSPYRSTANAPAGTSQPPATPNTRRRVGRKLQGLLPRPYERSQGSAAASFSAPTSEGLSSWPNDAEDPDDRSEWSEEDGATGSLLRALCRNEPRDEEVLPLITTQSAEETDSNGMLPLHWAAANDGASAKVALAILAASSSSARARDSYQRLPLHYAARYAPLAVVVALLEAYPAGARELDRDGKLPLHIAAANEDGSAAVLAALLRADLPIDPSTGRRAEEHAHSWTYAVGLDTAQAMEAIMLLLAPPEVQEDGHGLCRHIGALVDATDAEGRPALQLAAPETQSLLYEHVGRQVLRGARAARGAASKSRVQFETPPDLHLQSSPSSAELSQSPNAEASARRPMTAVILGTVRSVAGDGHLEHRIKVARGDVEWEVRRRFTQFRGLHAQLVRKEVRLERFSAPKVLGLHTTAVLKDREAKLQCFLNECLAKACAAQVPLQPLATFLEVPAH